MAAAVEGSRGEAASRRRTEVGGDRVTSPSCIVAVSSHVPRGAKLPAWAPGRRHRAREEVGQSSSKGGGGMELQPLQTPAAAARASPAATPDWTLCGGDGVDGVADGEQQRPGGGCRRRAAAAGWGLPTGSSGGGVDAQAEKGKGSLGLSPLVQF
jgi:hypothetical protein